MADTFLSCDTIKVHPENDNTKREQKQMIVLSTDALATDNPSQIRRTKPPIQKICCIIPVKAMAIFGVASTSLLSAAIYILCLIQLLNSSKTEVNVPKLLAVMSVVETIIILFAALFLWGFLARRQRLILPFTTLSCFLLFAVVGILIATIVMSGDEFSDAIEKNGNGNDGNNIVDLVIFRVALCVTAVVLAIEMYAYIRLYFYLGAVERSLPR